MQDKLVQATRYKLQKRVRRLNSAEPKVFPILIGQFLTWFDSVPILASVRDELLQRVPERVLTEDVSNVLAGQAWVADEEVEAAALGYSLLRKVADDPQGIELVRITHAYGSVRDTHDAANMFREMFLEPFYEYIDEHIDDQQAILYFLRHYKQRCEWFRGEELRLGVESETQTGERFLASDLYEYLHSQGIEFFIEPRSASGIADFVSEQIGDDRVVADTKIFWPDKSKGKAYLLAGFNQVYTYTRDFNEPCGYLVIYKMCKEDINFLVPATDAMFPCVTVNNKTIFFVVIDLCEHGVPASKRGVLKSYDITDEELVQSVGELEQNGGQTEAQDNDE